MTTTLTANSVMRTPQLVLGYSSTRSAGNIVHPVIGNPSPDVTLAAAGLRTGTLSMLCLNLADALAVQSLHTGPYVVVLADSDLPALNMTYVASGTIAIALDDETRTRWTVTVDFQEISA